MIRVDQIVTYKLPMHYLTPWIDGPADVRCRPDLLAHNRVLVVLTRAITPEELIAISIFVQLSFPGVVCLSLFVPGEDLLGHMHDVLALAIQRCRDAH